MGGKRKLSLHRENQQGRMIQIKGDMIEFCVLCSCPCTTILSLRSIRFNVTWLEIILPFMGRAYKI